MRRVLPLPTKLSFALVAFTIECDNEFERALLAPSGMDFATWRASRPPVFLVSVAMWANYLRHLTQPLTVRELAARAGNDDRAIRRNLNGLRRWRYVAVEPYPAATARPPLPGHLVRLTAAGQRCARLWQRLPAVVEARWRRRLGRGPVAELRRCLAALLAGRGGNWPHCMPILSSRREMFSLLAPGADAATAADAGPVAERPLLALLSQTLLSFTLEFEAESPVPLPVAANALRALAPAGIALRDLPRHVGISAAAIAQSLTLLRRHGLAVVGPPSAGKGRVVRLTRAGVAAQEQAQQRIARIERRWRQRLGAAATTATHDALDVVVGNGAPGVRPLAQALAATPGLWRSTQPPPTTLPHHPITVDRGGWPDGA